MRVLTGAAALLVVMVLYATWAVAQLQSDLNPEISFIADTRAIASSEDEGDVLLEFSELEIGAQGFLNPFARASVFVGIHEGNVDVEEAYVTFTTLPANLGLRAGRYLADVGRFIPQHDHAFVFLDYPLFVSEFFTEEGLSETGVNPSILIDLAGIPLTVSANVLSGDVEAHQHDTEEGAEDHETHGGARFFRDLTYTGRASLFFEVSRSTNFEIAGYGGTRIAELDEDRRNTWFGGDYKLKWRPHRRSSFVLEGEAIFHQADLEPETTIKAPGDLGSESAFGTFHYASYQFGRKWNVGGLVDYTQLAFDSNADVLGVGVFAGYSLFEESTVVRLVGRRDDRSNERDAETSLQLQVLFGLGPHKPHKF